MLLGLGGKNDQVLLSFVGACLNRVGEIPYRTAGSCIGVDPNLSNKSVCGILEQKEGNRGRFYLAKPLLGTLAS